MNLHQIQTEGSGHRLGPVTITKTFPSKPGDTSVFLLVKDDSGQGALKIWACPFGQAPTLGQVISLVTDGGPKSSITNKEYPVGSGKFSINASGCQVIREGASTPSHDPTPAAQSNAPTGTSHGAEATLEQTMQRAAEATQLYVQSLEGLGFTRQESVSMSGNAGAYYPLYWFGQKGIK